MFKIKKIMRSALFLFLSFISLVRCNGQNAQNSNEKQPQVITDVQSADIDVATAKNMIAKKPEIILLDVRTPEEIAAGKIDNAIEIDYKAPDFKDKLAALDKNKEYIVYCAVGGRSSKAVSIMQSLGFGKSYNLLGGYTAWSKNK